ncbi:hypothetical protein [Actinophytocola oryzae]|uniref:Uncharacterized protein n=1 Tax=Actinophytocola oryzae TaxID=502181 RepID=A0A4R7VWQ3_9PSEU|nr:hypothetical protein [Actinophytocola oryzae]TDV53919.1 hypothetical protein CLV71_104387 [Actinophytocola oryzae]
MSKAKSSPMRGSKVTFLLRDEHGERFRIGEVVGPLERDPITGEKWVGIRMADGRRRQTVSLIPLATVLNVTPPEHDVA